MQKASNKGLYFIAGIAPTDAERKEAAALGITAFRNADLAGSERVERCNIAAGAVPASYAAAGIQVLKPGPTAEELAAEAVMQDEASAKAQSAADVAKNKHRR